MVSRSPPRLKPDPAPHPAQAPERPRRPTFAAYNPPMNIRLNGSPLALPAPCTLIDLLAAQGLAARRVAVEVNGEIVPRGRHAEHLLAEGDVVEVVQALGGG